MTSDDVLAQLSTPVQSLRGALEREAAALILSGERGDIAEHPLLHAVLNRRLWARPFWFSTRSPWQWGMPMRGPSWLWNRPVRLLHEGGGLYTAWARRRRWQREHIQVADTTICRLVLLGEIADVPG